MSRFRRAALLAALVECAALPASAQVGATVVLRSGQSVGATIVDMNASGIVATVKGDDRAWPVSSVAVIDFVGGGKSFPNDELQKVTGGRHVLALRDGSIVVGELTDIGGRNPLRITFQSAGKDTDYSSKDVARIYFAKPKEAVAATPPSAPPPGRVRVPANGLWVNTGLSVVQGQTVRISTAGQIQLSADRSDVAGPAGSVKGRYAPGSPLPGAFAGALIGRIGTGQPFGIGNQLSFPAPANGMLYLAVNDNPAGDNAGEFGVDVTALPYRKR